MFLERQMTDNTMLDVAQIPLSPCFAGGGASSNSLSENYFAPFNSNVNYNYPNSGGYSL